MVKYYCDRCGKEVSSLITIRIPSKKTSKTSYSGKDIQVCKNCQKEAENICEKLLDIRFLLFGDFMIEMESENNETSLSDYQY